MEIINYNGGKKKNAARLIAPGGATTIRKRKKKKAYKKNQEHMQPLLNTTLTGKGVYASHQCTRPPPKCVRSFSTVLNRDSLGPVDFKCR